MRTRRFGCVSDFTSQLDQPVVSFSNVLWDESTSKPPVANKLNFY